MEMSNRANHKGDMDPHQARPSIQTVLRRQPMYRSSLLWDARLEGEIAAYITDARLDGLLQVPHMDLDHTLITALVERWRPETHSFHLSHGEMTITLQDMEVIMGVPVDGLPVVEYTDRNDWAHFCWEMLGHNPPGRDVGDRCKNTTVIEGPRVKAKWLEDRFSNPLPANATE
nr:serine/threonine-protein phosphatase 7 long form homolog [Quercus suber]